MSNIYILNEQNGISRAVVRSFDGGQMPPEIAAIRASCIQKTLNQDAVKDDKMQKPSGSQSRIEKSETPTVDRSETTVVDEYAAPPLSADQHRKVNYVCFTPARHPNDYEDIGSQTDLSDFSEGAYSDEEPEQKRNRERAIQEKMAKRQRRVKTMIRKHGILKSSFIE